MHCIVMALATLASLDNQQREHHSIGFFIKSAFELEAHAHLQCMARNRFQNYDAIRYTAYFTCLHAHSVDSLH